MKNKKLIVIVGPTAVGKTELAIQLAEHFQTEVISADSRQIFKELEIGTARPSESQLSRVRHHFIATRSLEQEYDAGKYGLDARALIEELFEKYEKLILCGGSGLYLRAALEGFDELPEISADVRKRIIAEYESKGLSWLQQQVGEADPEYYAGVDRQNPQRLMRALEVIWHTGKPFSGLHSKKKVTLPFEVVKIGLTLDRDELYERIDRRMDLMIEQGLFEEAEKFFPKRHLNAMQTVGYKEIFAFLSGEYDRVEAVRLLKRNSRRYAKRQLTWFLRDKTIRWFHPSEWDAMVNYCQP